MSTVFLNKEFKGRYVMAKSAFEKAIEKQQREAKKLADKQLREQKRQIQRETNRQIASTIVNGQPIIGGMRIMDTSSEEILRCILSVYDGNENREVKGNDTIIPTAYQSSLSLEFEKLKMYGVLSSAYIYISAVWEVVIAPQGLTYFEDKVQAEEKEKNMKKSSISIGSIVATGSNLILGDVVNSNLSIDNSIQRIESEIDEKGGGDSANLRELLDEVKELIENIQESRHIPKNKSLFERLSNHLEKHGWFYGEVVGLIGAATMQMLQR